MNKNIQQFLFSIDIAVKKNDNSNMYEFFRSEVRI